MFHVKHGLLVAHHGHMTQHKVTAAMTGADGATFSGDLYPAAHAERYPASDAPRTAVAAPIPALSVHLATDRGPVVVEVPPELLAAATTVSRITIMADDRTLISMPLFSHQSARALHTVCTAGGIELCEDL